MSQIGTIGAEFIQGGLSGLKAFALFSELRKAQLENDEFQATAGHRELMRQLAAKKAQSDLELQSINASILQQTLANMPDTETAQEGNKTQLAKGRADLEQIQASTGLTRANIGQVGANTKLTDANAAEQYARVAGQLGMAAGQGAAASKVDFTAEDASALADTMIGNMSIDDSQKVKAKAFLMPRILSSAKGALQQRDMLTQQNADISLRRKQETVSTLAEMASRTSDPVATLDQLGPHFAAPDEIAAAKAFVQGGFISKQQQAEDAKGERPWTGAEERMLRGPDEKVQDLKSQLEDLQQQKAEDYKYAGRKSQVGLLLKGGVKIDKAIELKQAELNVAQNEYEKLKESLRPKAKKGSTTVKLKSPKGDDEIVDFVSQEQVDNLPVGTRVRLPDGRIARKK